MSETVRTSIDAGVARIWIHRPEVHNAFDDEVVARLDEAISRCSSDRAVRVIVLGSEGRSFSAGADLNWMRRAAAAGDAENAADAAKLAGMLRRLAEAPQATVARVQGTALGGGLGLVCACDLAIATERARFGFSEVKLGLVPAVISPHAIAKIGPGRARELFVTGARFDARAAERYGLVARVVPDEEALDAALAETLEQLRSSAPGAVAASKKLIREVLRRDGAELDAYTAEQIAARRASEEAREGMRAFLEKRPPAWAAR